MEPLFYHSRPEDDPCGRGKRMTICCLVDNGKMVFGISKLNHKDHFIRAKGRLVSEARAKYRPLTAIDAPTDSDPKQFISNVRKRFVETRKEIVSKYLRSEKEMVLLGAKSRLPVKTAI